MAVFTLLEMDCDGCGANILFRDERPDWKFYDFRVEEADEAERSAKFVADHDGELEYQTLSQAWQAAGFPRFVDIFDVVPRLRIPEPKRYIDCPVCDARVYSERQQAGVG